MLEIIIVVAIIAVSATALLTSMSIVPQSAANGAANEIKAMLSQCRVETLGGKPDMTFELTYTDGEGFHGTIYSEGNLVSREHIAGVNIEVFYMLGDTRTKIEDGASLTLSFDGSTGALKDPLQLSSIECLGGESSYFIKITASTGFMELTRTLSHFESEVVWL